MTGQFVALNLGPRFDGGGAFVGLNLGVNWYDDAPEPVVRGIRQGADIAWGRPRAVRRLCSVSWDESLALGVSVAHQWGSAPRVRYGASLEWSMVPLVGRSAEYHWRRSMTAVADSWLVGWGYLPVARQQLSLEWGSALRSINRSVVAPWARMVTAVASRRLRWLGEMPSILSGREIAWANAPAGRAAVRLPWRAARQVPWGVRPKPDPGPDPDPGAGFPPGNYVGLRLGCSVIGVPGLAPLNLGIAACYVARPQRRTYVVINTVSFVRLPDRTPIEVTRISLAASRGAWGWTFDFELADPSQLALLKPTAAGPRQFEITLNGYVWTGIVETFQKQREFAGGGVRLSGRSRTALLAAPYAPARVKASSEDRSMAQLVAEELADTGFASDYQTVDWNVPAGAWFYDASTPLDAISALAGASGAVVQSHPADLALTVRPAYPASPWLWRETVPDHVLQEDIVLTESLQMRSAPLYDAVVVTGELAGKGVTCKVRRAGEAGQLFAPQASSPLINVAAAGAERGRNILCDRGEQAAVDLTMPLFAKPLKVGEVGLIMPLDLVQFVGSEGTWPGQCESLRIEVTVEQQAVVIEQTATLERHYTDAD